MDYLTTLREQINDLFSDFRKYIAPTYYHDRCERSLHMHLYVMHKRDILLTLSAFVAGFVLLLFIGFAGPNATKTDSILATEIFQKDNINGSDASKLLAHGPFILTTPYISPYGFELCVWVTFYLKKEDESEAFHKNFIVLSKIEGLNGDLKATTKTSSSNQASNNAKAGVLVWNETLQGVTHHLYCAGQVCDPVEVIHLEPLTYDHYRIGLSFQNLDSVHEKYVIRDIEFVFQTMNPSFTTLSIWFRLVFLLIAFVSGIWFIHSLHRHPFSDWSLEQKWVSFLFVLLVLYDNPLYPLVFLVGSQKPRSVEILFSATFYCALLYFWLCFYHGIRQSSRSWSKFYAPKACLVGTIWFGSVSMLIWSSSLRMHYPTAAETDQFDESILLNGISIFYFLALAAYFGYLAILVLAAFTELRAMPYFDRRLKLQTFLMLFTLLIGVLVCLCSTPNVPTTINTTSATNAIPASEAAGFVVGSNAMGSAAGAVGGELDLPIIRTLPTAYETTSSGAFLALLAVSNLYVTICGYFYHPSNSSLMDSRVVRDNPTMSMINDSDEEVIYGSDTDPDVAAEVNPVSPKLVDTKTDEESD